MPPSPDAALPRRQDEHGAWWRQTIAGRWVQWEPGWHRGQRRQREHDRQVLRLVAMCFRLSQHHGSMPPKLVADLFTNRWFSGDGFSGGGGGKDFSSREDKDFKRHEAAAKDKDSSGGGGKYSSSSGGKDCKFQASVAEARTDSKQHGGGQGEDPSSSCSKDFKFQAEAEKASTPSTEHHGQAAKAVRTLDMENVARFLVEGIVQVLQIRQKQGKAPLPVDQVASEFRACWTTPFILAQAGETDTVTFLRKWPTKIDVVQEQGEYVVQLAKPAGEKSKVPAMVPQCAPAPPTIRKEAARAQAYHPQGGWQAACAREQAGLRLGSEMSADAPAFVPNAMPLTAHFDFNALEAEVANFLQSTATPPVLMRASGGVDIATSNMHSYARGWQIPEVPASIRLPWRVFEEDLQDKFVDASRQGAEVEASVREQISAVQVKGAQETFLELN
ncbi:unnamed protein product [Polarella glacialis]|uniref:Uncharacterized protein n=1 Tax=Polarella glacialis TaxID=89957 RepID=A0A813KL12_POLGL|nr:unnamed protein product [Polarella glacialis]